MATQKSLCISHPVAASRVCPTSTSNITVAVSQVAWLHAQFNTWSGGRHLVEINLIALKDTLTCKHQKIGFDMHTSIWSALVLSLQRPVTTILYTIEFPLKWYYWPKPADGTWTKKLPKSYILVTMLIETAIKLSSDQQYKLLPNFILFVICVQFCYWS